MSAVTAVLESALRAAAVGLLAAACAPALAQRLRRSRGWRLLALAVLLTPRLVVAYAWSTVPWGPVQRDWGRELLYVLLLAGIWAPVAAAMRWWLGDGGRGRARHAARLMGGGGGGAWRVHLVCALPVFLLAFAEFEMASLLVVEGFSVWLFDAQQGGLPLADSLWAALPAVALQALVLVAGLAALRRLRPGEDRPVRRWPARLWAAWAAAAVLVLPLGTLLLDVGTGLPAAIADYGLLGETVDGLVLAATATLAVLCLTPLLLGGGWWRGLLCCLPGLAGSLVVGLLGLACIALLPLLGQTVLPWLGALLLLLLPAAWLGLQAWRRGDDGGRQALRLMGAGPVGRLVSWRRSGRPLLLLGLALFWLAYQDQAASTLLAPPDHAPVTAPIYNFMHYGRSDALSGMVLVAWGLPLILLTTVGGLVELAWYRIGGRGRGG